jgi:predicted transcriptional regulator
MSDELKVMTAQIVSAFVGRNVVGVGDLADLIRDTYQSLATAGQPPVEVPTVARLAPAQVRKSISPEALISFEDGRPYKSLKRHLSGRGLTPDEYRAKWGLPKDYPMVSPGYSARRSALAKAMGLGKPPAPAPEPAKARKRTPRTRAAAQGALAPTTD